MHYLFQPKWITRGPIFNPNWRYLLLPPANEVWGKVICLHLFVILFTGGLPQCMLGCSPGTRQMPPGTRQTPPPQDQADTLRDQADTPVTRQTPQDKTPPGPSRQCVGGMYPTGMQSCFKIILIFPM